MTKVFKSPQIINKENDKIKTHLFLPINPNYNRISEGGLRKKGIFKISDQDKPLISIITTNLNDDLESTILSVIDQDYENIEFIIKDGGSDETTRKILESYNDNIDYWVIEKDNGIYDGINGGLKVATGDYIVILDSGDVLNKNALNSIVKLAKNNPKADCLLGSCLKQRLMHGYRPDEINLRFNIFASNSGSFFLKREAYKTIGFYDTRYIASADYDLLYKMIVKYKMVGVCGDKDNILSIKPEGGFSDQYPFLKTLYDECRIRFNNNQNFLIIFYIFIARCISKILSRIKKFDGNKMSNYLPNENTNLEIKKARAYYKNILNKRKFLRNA